MRYAQVWKLVKMIHSHRFVQAGRAYPAPLALLLLACAPVFAQQYSISTVAGGAPPATPASATGIGIGQPRRVAVDSAGNVYFSSGNCIFEIAGGQLALIAGNSRPGFSGDGGPATSAMLNQPQGIAIDASGNIYIADTLNNRVRVVNSSGIIRTFAGTGQVGGPNNFGDGGPAVQAYLHLPGGVAVDKSGNVYIADTADNTIRKVTPDGNIATIAGDGYPSYQGDTGAANTAELHSPQDVAVDSSGNVYIADTGNALIRKINTDGVINLVAGTPGLASYAGDNGAATSAGIIEPYSVAVDSNGNIFIAEPNDGRIREVTVSNGKINTVAGNGTLGFTGDGSTATNAELNRPTGLALDSSGNVYIADSVNNRVRKVSGGNISTVAGNGVYSYSGDGGPATSAQFNSPQAVAVDAAGNLYIADTGNNVVRQVTAKGIVTTIAGTGTAGFGGDNGAATSAQLNAPQGIAVDSAGNVYVADTANSRVRKISNGTITTVAGSGTVGYGGDGGAAASAQLNTPVGLAFDKGGNLYIADLGNNVIRKVSTSGSISTVAGNGSQGYSGDNGLATLAQLNGPESVAVDSAGNLYIADTLNSAVREVTAGGTILTVAGTGFPGYSGDGHLATAAQLGSPTAVAVDSAGNVYIADSGARIRKVFSAGVIVTIAGTGIRNYTGDGGAATSATMNGATGISMDANGDLFLADASNNAIRELTFTGSGISISAAVDGASNQFGSIVPGEVVALYGSNIGAPSLISNTPTNGVFGTSVGGTSVIVNGALAPILYTSPSQVGFIVPFSITGGTAQISVFNQNQASAPVTANVAAANPAIFTLDQSGQGQAAAINQDGSINSAAHPAKAGSYVSLYITGAGQLSTPVQDGSLATSQLNYVSAPTLAAIGGKNAKVQYAGASPGTVNGVVQVNVQVPDGLAAGNVPVIVQVGAAASQGGVTIAVTGN
jgi:uncharacterized protein (TIGR03437 family)